MGMQLERNISIAEVTISICCPLNNEGEYKEAEVWMNGGHLCTIDLAKKHDFINSFMFSMAWLKSMPIIIFFSVFVIVLR